MSRREESRPSFLVPGLRGRAFILSPSLFKIILAISAGAIVYDTVKSTLFLHLHFTVNYFS